MAVIAFVRAHLRAIPIAQDPLKSKAIGSQIRIRQITCRAGNGSAAAANQ